MSRSFSTSIKTNNPTGDPFGRLRVSEPYTIFDSKLVTGKAALYYDEVVNDAVGASSTHDSTDASVSMTVDGNGDYVIRQTFMRFNYQPGKGQLIYLTGVLGEPVASTESRIGYFNTSTTAPYTANRDGIYFGQDGTNNYVAISKNGTENKIIQSSWNLDKMDGTGPSGITADFDLAQIFIIDFEWLGVGRVRCGLNIGGVTYYVHEFNHANQPLQTGVYMTSSNHSIRYEVRSTGGDLTIKHICASIQSEGGVEPSGISRCVNTGITTQGIGTTKEAVIGFRLADNSLCSTIIPEIISAMSTGNEDTQWELQLNPTYANTPTWNSAGTSSPAEFAVGNGSNTVSVDGEILAGGYGSDDLNNLSLDINTVIHPGLSITGVKDEIWLVVRTVTGSGDYVGSINFRELNCG
jgi:hypothetical protein